MTTAPQSGSDAQADASATGRTSGVTSTHSSPDFSRIVCSIVGPGRKVSVSATRDSLVVIFGDVKNILEFRDSAP